jgi:phosphate transport system substrate-binding protein
VLDGKTLADIYLGKITRWNDAELEALNPNARLPDVAIVVVHRSDGSGTTREFTAYLANVSPEWASKVGSNSFLNWPVGTGGKGAEGVAPIVARTVGAIGYLELLSAAMNNLTTIDLINASGHRVKPEMRNFEAAIANADFARAPDFDLIPVNQPGERSWPIMSMVFLLMRPDTGVERNRQVLTFVDDSLHDGAGDAEKLSYAPLPSSVVRQVEGSWKTTLQINLP